MDFYENKMKYIDRPYFIYKKIYPSKKEMEDDLLRTTFLDSQVEYFNNNINVGDLVLIDYEEGRYRSIYAKDVETIQEDLPSNPLPITIGETTSQNFYFDLDYNYPLTKENCKVGDFFQQENENGVLKIWKVISVSDESAELALLEGEYDEISSAADVEKYNKAYGGTVWQKVFVNNKTSYVLIADLNVSVLNNFTENIKTIQKTLDTEMINVKLYGIGENKYQDDAELIENLIKNNNLYGKTLYFPKGNYYFTTPLKIDARPDKGVSLLLDDRAYIKSNNTQEIDALLIVGHTPEDIISYFHTEDTMYSKEHLITIVGGVWDATNTKVGIHCYADRMGSQLKNLSVINVKKQGIVLDKASNKYAKMRQDNNKSALSISQALVDNVYICGERRYPDEIKWKQIGLHILGTDNQIKNLVVLGVKRGISVEAGGNQFTDVHITAGFSKDTTMEYGSKEYYKYMNDTVGIEIYNSSNQFTNIYCDTCGTAVDLYDNKDAKSVNTFSNFYTYYYLSSEDFSKWTGFKINNIFQKLFVTGANFDFNPKASENIAIQNTSDSSNVYYANNKRIIFKNSTAKNLTKDSDLFRSPTVNEAYEVYNPALHRGETIAKIIDGPLTPHWQKVFLLKGSTSIRKGVVDDVEEWETIIPYENVHNLLIGCPENGRAVKISCSVANNKDASKLVVTKVFEASNSENKYQIALGGWFEERISENYKQNWAYLYIKPLDINTSIDLYIQEEPGYYKNFRCCLEERVNENEIDEQSFITGKTYQF